MTLQQPAVHDIAPMTLPESHRSRLDNGMEITFIPCHQHPVTYISLQCDGGTAEYLADREAMGAATMLCYHGIGHLSRKEVFETLDLNGASLSGSLGDHKRAFTLTTVTQGLRSTLPLLVGAVTEPQFEAQSVAVMRQQLMARYEMMLQDVGTWAGLLCNEALRGPGHPLNVRPDKDKIAAITPEVLKDVFGGSIDASRTRAYVCGSYSDDDQAYIIEMLSRVPNGAGYVPDLDIRPLDPQCGRYFQALDGKHQNALQIAIPLDITRGDKDYSTLRLGVQALGGYFGSRLMANIRERHGYTYGIQASLIGSLEGSALVVATQCDRRYSHAVIEETLGEIQRIPWEAPVGEELARLRRKAMLVCAMVLESPAEILGEVSLPDTIGAPADYYQQRQRAARDLSSRAIAEVWQRWVDPSRLIVAEAGTLPNV